MRLTPVCLERHRQQQAQLICDLPRPLHRVCCIVTGQPAPALEITREGRHGTPRIAMRQDCQCSFPESVCHFDWLDFRNVHRVCLDQVAAVAVKLRTKQLAFR